MNTLGARLREERERLGMSQAKFAALGGAKRTSQFNYEAGIRAPDTEYLVGVANAGVDILYVLTGQRNVVCLDHQEKLLLQRYRTASQDVKRSLSEQCSPERRVTELPPDERLLLENYRAAPDDMKQLIRQTSSAFATRNSEKKRLNK